VQQFFTAQIGERLTRANHHPGDALLRINLLPGQGLSICRKPPQLLQQAARVDFEEAP
jgi:hypothetical protein